MDQQQDGFSALQRAENSSILPGTPGAGARVLFQCSSASRKFLNIHDVFTTKKTSPFQCSSASRKFLNESVALYEDVIGVVSVLFSEPKIPQLRRRLGMDQQQDGFSALQRAENSSITVVGRSRQKVLQKFQCSSASRKFLNSASHLVT